MTQAKSKENADPVAAMLNRTLASTLDLKLQIKQAHWNVRGSTFIGLHELFDKVAADVDGYADEIAERAVQLGTEAHGRLQDISGHSSLPAYPQGIHEGLDHIKAVEAGLQKLTAQVKRGIEESDDREDAVTADILTRIAGGLDKWIWMVGAHKG